MSELVPMVKGGATIHVHPENVEAHKHLGWNVAKSPKLEVKVNVMDLPEVKEALAQANETIAELRARIAELEGAEPKLEDLKAGELIAYAEAHHLDIGGLVPQAGKERILAAVLEAKAKKG